MTFDIIDDRDVINISQPCLIDDSPKQSDYDITRNILQNEFGLGKVEHLGEGFFHLEFATIVCTGSNITQYCMIPFKHKLHQFIVKHTDTNDADCTDALAYTLKYGLGQVNPNLLLTLKDVSASAVSDTIHLYTDFWRRQSRYQLITNTTVTDKLYVSLIIEIENINKPEVL